ncbi:hypothetical protein ACFE04_030480 [Oxalis oulophora]
MNEPKLSKPLPKYLQENSLTQQCQDLLANLPSDNGWVATNLYQYQGFWLTARFLQGVLNCQTHFHAQDSDILLTTTPKSGTSWLKALTFSLVNRSRYPEQTNHPLLSSNPHDIVPFLEIRLFVDTKMPDFSNLGFPRIVSTHLPFGSMPKSVKETPCKIVYLCRNPKDTLVSLWHFSSKLRLEGDRGLTIEEAFDRFCKGVSLYGPFWDHVLEYWKESLDKPEKVMFLKYEELKTEPVRVLKKLAGFLGCPFSVEEEENGVVQSILKLCSFENLSSVEVNVCGKLVTGEENKFFFRRGEVGDYVNYLTPKMIQRLDEITREKFSVYGLEL